MKRDEISHTSTLKYKLLSGRDIERYGVAEQICELTDPARGRIYPMNSVVLCTMHVINRTTGDVEAIDFMYKIKNLNTDNLHSSHELLYELWKDLNNPLRLDAIAIHLSSTLQKQKQEYIKENKHKNPHKNEHEVEEEYYNERKLVFLNGFMNKYGTFEEFRAEIVPITLTASTSTGGVIAQVMNSAPGAEMSGHESVHVVSLANNVLHNEDDTYTHLLTPFPHTKIWVDRTITLEYEPGEVEDANGATFDVVPLSADLYSFRCVDEHGLNIRLYMFWDDACGEPTEEHLHALVDDNKAFGSFGFNNRLITTKMQQLIAYGTLQLTHVHRVFLEATYEFDYEDKLIDVPGDALPTCPL